jgi:hypothetical protein
VARTVHFYQPQRTMHYPCPTHQRPTQTPHCPNPPLSTQHQPSYTNTIPEPKNLAYRTHTVNLPPTLRIISSVHPSRHTHPLNTTRTRHTSARHPFLATRTPNSFPSISRPNFLASTRRPYQSYSHDLAHTTPLSAASTSHLPSQTWPSRTSGKTTKSRHTKQGKTHGRAARYPPIPAHISLQLLKTHYPEHPPRYAALTQRSRFPTTWISQRTIDPPLDSFLSHAMDGTSQNIGHDPHS